MKAAILLITAWFTATMANAQTWTGITSTDWNTASNWSPNTVPAAGSNVIVPGTGITNWPVLANDVSVTNFTLNGYLDTKGYGITTAGNVDLNGATVNNTQAGTVIKMVMTGNNNIYIRNAAFNDSTNFTVSDNNAVYEGYNGANHFSGNVKFTLNGTGDIYLSYGNTSVYDGNLTVNRTVAGNTSLFNYGTSGAIINGDFSYTNNAGGNAAIGVNSSNYPTRISGKLMINCVSPAGSSFGNAIYYVKNNTAGGSINIQNVGSFNTFYDTLKVNSFTVSGWKGGTMDFNNNSITANLSIADSAANGNELDFRNNLVTGNTNITYNGSNAVYEGYSGANHFVGNTAFTVNGPGSLNLSYGNASVYDGNLTVNRTVAGNTSLFNYGTSGAIINGDFSYTNNAGGNAAIGVNSSNYPTRISGKLMINCVSPAGSSFGNAIYYVKNGTAGGSINIQNVGSFSTLYDTLKVNSFTVSGWKGGGTMDFNSNSITANLSIADSAANGNELDFRNNLVTGSTNITYNGSNAVYEGYSGANHFVGNTTFAMNGTGSLNLSYGNASVYDGNLTVNRTMAGNTSLFNYGTSGAIINGDFSYTNNAGGNAAIGVNSSNYPTRISGKLMINCVSPAGSSFGNAIYYVKNNTAGGSINIQNVGSFNTSYDTLKVNSFTVSGWKGGGTMDFNSNSITANLSIADSAANGNELDFRNNLVTGNTSITYNGSNAVYEGYSGANHFVGNTAFTVNGPGSLYLSYGNMTTYDGNLTVNRTMAGNTSLFNYGTSGAIINGDFSYTNNAGGNAAIGNNSSNYPTRISGKLMINCVSPAGSSYGNAIYYVKNNTSGGSINIQNVGSFNTSYDTLKVNSFTVSGWKGGGTMDFNSNSITANLSIADSAANGNELDFRNNLVTGNTNITYNGSNAVYEGYGGANQYAGNASFTNNGSNTFYVAYSDSSRYSANLTLAGANFTLGSRIKFNGNTNSTLQWTAQTLVLPGLTMDKTGTGQLTLMQPTSISGNLMFIGGNIKSSTASPLIILNNATTTGAGNSSHVTGPVTKIGNQDFVFPTGDSVKLSTAAMSAPANATDQFTAQYFSQNTTALYDTAQRAATLKKVLGSGYWDVKRDIGSSDVTVTLGYNVPAGFITNPAKLRVAHWNGTLWEDLGNGGTAGNNNMGTLVTATLVSNFSPFTLGTTDAIANPLSTFASPLPVNLMNFTVQKQNNTAALQWVVASEQNCAHYEVERSSDSKTFVTISTVKSSNSAVQKAYNTTDDAPLNGADFYRLKIVDFDGGYKYSNTVQVKFDKSSDVILYPNPARSTVTIQGLKHFDKLAVTDILGKVVMQQTIVNDNETVNIIPLPAGVYALHLLADDGTETIKFVKQ